MRHEKGAVTMFNLQEEIKKKMFVGTSEDDALARLSEQQTLKAITLSITTRGIGLGTCHLAFISISYYENIRVPSCYAMYRVFLGLLEAKIEAIKTDLPVVPRLVDQIKQPRVNSDMLRAAQTVTIIPEPIRRVINAIGYVKYEEKIYVPAVAKDPTDRRGNWTPRPENVLLSTLRRTVEYLSDPEATHAVRRRFRENSPFPAAIWNDDDVLQNPNDIIPANYDLYNDFRRESLMIAPYMVALQKHVPKLVGGVLDFKSTGHNSLLISNEMQNLKAPDRIAGEELNDYYRRCVPEGNIRNYYALARLTPAERIEGQVNLLGEYPSPVNLRYPMYHMRDEVAAAHDVTSDYAGLCQIMYAM